MSIEQSASKAQEPRISLIQAIIVFQGLMTIWATIVFMPVGLALMLANVVLGFASKGINRKLFFGFAISSALIGLSMGLGLFAVGSTGLAEVVPD